VRSWSRVTVAAWFVLGGLAANACIPSRMGNGRGQVGQQGQGYPTGQPTGTLAPYGNPTTTAPLPPTPTTTTTAPPTQTGTARRPPRLTLPGRRPPRTTPPATTVATPPPTVPGCGEVDVDGVKIPLDCYSAGYVAVAGMSQTVARGTFSTAASAVPEYIDHRREAKEGPVRAQRTSGSGAANALAGAIDQALFALTAQPVPVSSLHLFARAPTSSFADVVKASLDKTITSESVLPFDEAKACAWGDANASRLCPSKDHRAPDPADVSRADAAPAARLTSVIQLDGTNIEELRDTIGRGRDVVVALRVDSEAWRSVVRAAEDEPLLPDYVGALGVHTVSLAGYAKQDGAWFFLIKNSWGPLWGKNGYAWIQETTLKKNVLGAWVIQAALGTAAAPPPPPPVASGCPAGFTNTGGTCVIAQPTQSGADPGTGLIWACGAAGCTYTWRKGTLGCATTQCTLSCATPRHLAAVDKGKKTVSCTE
jgi:hypothetical protein